jgi:hypothetical protein
MMNRKLIARDVFGIFQREAELLAALDESIAANEIVVAVDAWAQADDLKIPRTLQQQNTPVAELSRANWSDPEQLADEVVPFLGQLCTFWENVYCAHESAINRFRSASSGGAPYCFYLRSFRHVVASDDNDRDIRVAIYPITTGLDFALEQALSRACRAINPVSCLHTDDLALLAGEWSLPAIRVHGHNWQEPIKNAIRGGKAIVFYVGAPSEGTDVELAAIRKARLRDRTILVYEYDTHLPADAGEFAARFSLAEFLTSPKRPLTARLTAKARARVTELMNDAFKSPAPSKTLLDLRCAVVDPDLTKELPGTVNRHNVLCITPTNLSSFACYVVGFPDTVRNWEEIAMRPASRNAKSGAANLHQLQVTANYAWGGAVALGLTASIAAATGFRVVFSNFSRLTGAKAKAKRKVASLDVLTIAARFDALTTNHQWREQISEWSSMIESDALPLP